MWSNRLVNLIVVGLFVLATWALHAHMSHKAEEIRQEQILNPSTLVQDQAAKDAFCLERPDYYLCR